MEQGLADRRDLALKRGFTLIEMIITITIITFLMGTLVVAFTGVRKRALKSKTVAQLEAIDAAMSQYYMYFHRYPPDSHAAGTDLEDVSGSECIVYYLRTAFKLGENMPGTSTKPSMDAGPFLEFDKAHIKDDAADGAGDTYDSIIDPYGNVWRYDHKPEPADFPQSSINVHSYNLWSHGVDGQDDLGDDDDIANWVGTE